MRDTEYVGCLQRLLKEKDASLTELNRKIDEHGAQVAEQLKRLDAIAAENERLQTVAAEAMSQLDKIISQSQEDWHKMEAQERLLREKNEVIRELEDGLVAAHKRVQEAVETAEANILADIQDGGKSCEWCRGAMAKPYREQIAELEERLVDSQRVSGMAIGHQGSHLEAANGMVMQMQRNADEMKRLYDERGSLLSDCLTVLRHFEAEAIEGLDIVDEALAKEMADCIEKELGL